MFYAVRSDSKDLCYYSDFLRDFFSNQDEGKSTLTLACSREVTRAFEGVKNIKTFKGYL